MFYFCEKTPIDVIKPSQFTVRKEHGVIWNKRFCDVGHYTSSLHNIDRSLNLFKDFCTKTEKNMMQHISTTWNAVPGMVPLVIPKQYAHMQNPMMTIRNECLTSETFRKVHIEHATYGDLDIVHHVAFPHFSYDIPILGIDMIQKKGIPTMAIADVSGKCGFEYAIVELQNRHKIHDQKKRELPDWGREIFSEHCVFLDAPNPEVFESYVADLLKVYIDFAMHQGPCITNRKQEQIRYCTHQLQNTRTRSLLQKAFGMTLADGYMQDVMFSW